MVQVQKQLTLRKKARGHVVITLSVQLPYDKWVARDDISLLPSHLYCESKAYDRWQDHKILYLPLIWWNGRSRGQWMFITTTWDRAVEFQALRMINGSANPGGLQTQMRTELIAVWNTLAWVERKCSELRPKKGPVAALTSSLAFAYKSSLGVHKSQTAYSWNCP